MVKKFFVLLTLLCFVSPYANGSNPSVESETVEKSEEEIANMLLNEIEDSSIPEAPELLEDDSTVMENLKLFWNLPREIKVEYIKSLSYKKGSNLKEFMTGTCKDIGNNKTVFGVGVCSGVLTAFVIHAIHNYWTAERPDEY